MYKPRRLTNNPIIFPDMPGYHTDALGTNINGPSLIYVPDWVPSPLGQYYLYFANHGGDHIRLAYADHVEGPYRLHEPGTLRLGQTPCWHHIASPEIRIDNQLRRIYLYYHGPTRDLSSQDDPAAPWYPDVVGEAQIHGEPFSIGDQRTHVAVSNNGLDFQHLAGPLMEPYARLWWWRDYWYALVMPGHVWRCMDGLHDWQPGPWLFNVSMRHAAVRVMGDQLEIYYSNAGDAPESILCSRVALTEDWSQWHASPAEGVLEPTESWEGDQCPLTPSRRGPTKEPARQLRDPALFHDLQENHWYLLYSVAGEYGIAIAQLEP